MSKKKYNNRIHAPSSESEASKHNIHYFKQFIKSIVMVERRHHRDKPISVVIDGYVLEPSSSCWILD